MILHLALLALAVFFIWETARVILPVGIPEPVIAAGLLAVTGLLDLFVGDRELGLMAVVAVVGILHQRFGVSSTGAYAVRLPRRSRKIDLP